MVDDLCAGAVVDVGDGAVVDDVLDVEGPVVDVVDEPGWADGAALQAPGGQ